MFRQIWIMERGEFDCFALRKQLDELINYQIQWISGESKIADLFRIEVQWVGKRQMKG